MNPSKRLIEQKSKTAFGVSLRGEIEALFDPPRQDRGHIEKLIAEWERDRSYCSPHLGRRARPMGSGLTQPATIRGAHAISPESTILIEEAVMLPVLDNQAMREADRHTIEDLGVPGLVLMENAATGVVDALRDSFPDARRVLVLCGPGNNGGDGLAAARHLSNGGHDVSVLLFGDPEQVESGRRHQPPVGSRFPGPIADRRRRRSVDPRTANSEDHRPTW